MPRTAKLSTTLAALVLAAGALAGCTTAEPTPSAETPTPTYLTELPEWARESDPNPWLVYPDGMECYGTEGCPNDYRAVFGEPGPELPEGVEYYDPDKHECVVVRPADVDCFG